MHIFIFSMPSRKDDLKVVVSVIRVKRLLLTKEPEKAPRKLKSILEAYHRLLFNLLSKSLSGSYGITGSIYFIWTFGLFVFTHLL